MTAGYVKIGLISDTHGHLPEDVSSIFNDLDAIIHAGDIGGKTVLQKLEELAPVTAVRGNCDTGLLSAFFEDVELMHFAGHDLAVMHRLSQAQPLIAKGFKGILIFGHTHKPDEFDRDGVFYINPGSVSHPRGVKYGTVAILTLKAETPPKVDFIELK